MTLQTHDEEIAEAAEILGESPDDMPSEAAACKIPIHRNLASDYRRSRQESLDGILSSNVKCSRKRKPK